MDILRQVCALITLVASLTLAGGPAMAGDRVNEICVISPEISYCVPRDS